MDTTTTFGFIGAGAMGGAIAKGLIEARAFDSAKLAIADPNEDIRASFDAIGPQTFNDAATMLNMHKPDVVVVAVKPQIIKAVLQPLAPALADKLVVSIVAGISLETLYKLVGHKRVIRTMPNLPMQDALGAVAISAGDAIDTTDVTFIQGLFSHLGCARVMREDQLDVAGIISGASPAFFALFIDALTRAGVRAGMSAQDAREMATATMRGTAEQLLSSQEHPREYMERICSPGGTTIAALHEMEEPLVYAVEAGLDAALARTRELSGD